LVDDVCPHYRSKGSKREEEEERRLLFVAITRAKHKLYLLSPKTNQIDERVVVIEPTPWLKTLRNKSYVEFDPIPRPLMRKMEESEDLALFMKEYLEKTTPKHIVTTCDQEERNTDEAIPSSSSTAPLFVSASNYINPSEYQPVTIYSEEEKEEDFSFLVDLEDLESEEEEIILPELPKVVKEDSQSMIADFNFELIEEDEEEEYDLPIIPSTKKRKF